MVPGSHHVFFPDAAHRQHAVVKDQARTEKVTGMRNLPFKHFARDQPWMLAANIASVLLAQHALCAETSLSIASARLWKVCHRSATCMGACLSGRHRSGPDRWHNRKVFSLRLGKQ